VVDAAAAPLRCGAALLPARSAELHPLEPGSRLLFFLAAATAIAVMPLEYKLATAALVLLRYGVVFAEIWRITRRLGERGLRGAYFVYDLLSPFYEMLVALLCLRRDDRVWR